VTLRLGPVWMGQLFGWRFNWMDFLPMKSGEWAKTSDGWWIAAHEKWSKCQNKQVLTNQFERNRRNRHFLIVFAICLFSSHRFAVNLWLFNICKSMNAFGWLWDMLGVMLGEPSQLNWTRKISRCSLDIADGWSWAALSCFLVNQWGVGEKDWMTKGDLWWKI
jgi:hypothetical protein